MKEATTLYRNEKLLIGLDEMIYAFDSSTIELYLNKLCPWAEFHHGKGAFKMYTLMDLRRSIPTFVLLTPSKVNDGKVMDKIPVEAGAFYLMDKGYVAFEKLYKFFQQKGEYFVTRAKDNISYEVIESRPATKTPVFFRTRQSGLSAITLHGSILTLCNLLHMRILQQGKSIAF